MANKKSKINLEYGYSITINEDDILTIVTTDTEGESIEFDGKNGNLMIAGDMESWFDDEEWNATLSTMTEYSVEFLTDWGVDEETAKAITEELTPWFERYAISEEEATEMEISNIEEVIVSHKNTIARLMHSIDEDNKRVNEIKAHISTTAEEVSRLSRELKKYEGMLADITDRR